MCITFDKGEYAFYFDGAAVDITGLLPPLTPGPINSQTATTIGYVKTSPDTFNGYIDDVSISQNSVSCYLSPISLYI